MTLGSAVIHPAEGPSAVGVDVGRGEPQCIGVGGDREGRWLERRACSWG